MKTKSTLLLLNIVLFHALAGCTLSASKAEANTLSVNGDLIYYEIVGEGYPLLLPSGGSGMDLRQWSRVIPALAQDYQVISFDPRGIGKSDNPTGRYSDADDIAALMDHLSLERVGLVGLSSSGGLVLEFTSLYPERVSGVVAAAPFIPGFEFSNEMKARLEVFNASAQAGREPFLKSMFDDPHFIPAPLDSSARQFARNIMAFNYDKGAVFDPSLPVPIDPPLIERLRDIITPVLLLVGELDHPEVKRRSKFVLQEIASASEKTVSQAGHNGHLENPDEFVRVSQSFLRQISQ